MESLRERLLSRKRKLELERHELEEERKNRMDRLHHIDTELNEIGRSLAPWTLLQLMVLEEVALAIPLRDLRRLIEEYSEKMDFTSFAVTTAWVLSYALNH